MTRQILTALLWAWVLVCPGTAGAAKEEDFDKELALASAQARSLQEWGLPPVVYFQDPSTVHEEQEVLELYDLDLQEPTETGKALLEVLESRPEREVRGLTKKRLSLLLYTLHHLYVTKLDDPRYTAQPGLLKAYRRAAEKVLSRSVAGEPDCLAQPGHPECAGLGKSVKPLHEVLAEREQTLAQALDALAASGAKGGKDKAEILERVRAEMATLRLGDDGSPLIPSTLEWLVKALPESALTETQWRVLFESYPMGKSLWASRADRLWRRKINGEGVVVAVLDTGVDKDHPFLKGRVSDWTNQTNHVHIDPAARDASQAPLFGKPDNRGEHGTHVAGTVAAYAPGAHVVNLKVLDEEATTYIAPELVHDDARADEAIRRGLEEVHRHNETVDAGKARGRVDIVNLSLGTGKDRAAVDPSRLTGIARWVRKLWRQGVHVIVASGNEGPKPSMATPAFMAEAITVGSVDYFHRLADSSSHQLLVDRASGGSWRKPDVLSHGVDVDSANFDPKQPYGVPAASLSERGSGTSMATPHVAGMAALLVQAARRRGVRLLPEQLREILVRTGDRPANANPYVVGPVVNLGKALEYLKEKFLKKGQDIKT